jgi:type IV secretion system protein VirB8
MSKDAALEHYFAESASWDADRYAQKEKSERRAWWAATAGWVCAIAAVIAVASLTPLKSVQPYVIRVDRSTGIVDVVPVFSGSAEVEEAVTRFFLTRYILVCEGFYYGTAERDYTECGAFNTARRNQELYALWQKGNPASPLNLYQDGSTIRAHVRSVTFFRAGSEVGLAQIRFALALRRGGSGTEVFSQWIATLQYAYGAPSKDPAIRQWNPLGLRILEYRRETEVITPDPSESARAGLAKNRGAP